MTTRKTTLLISALLLSVVLVPRANAADPGLSGTVVRAGAPVASVWVVVNGGGQVAKALTGDDGRFYLGGLKAGTYGVRVTDSDGTTLFSGSVSVPLDGAYTISL